MAQVVFVRSAGKLIIIVKQDSVLSKNQKAPAHAGNILLSMPLLEQQNVAASKILPSTLLMAHVLKSLLKDHAQKERYVDISSVPITLLK